MRSIAGYVLGNAGYFTFLMLAFTGIPLTSGFTGKFAVFSAAVSQGWAWLAVIGVLASAVTAYIYFTLVVQMWLGEPGAATDTVVVRPSWMTSVAILVGVAITLALGVMPSPVLDLAQSTAAFLR